VNITVESLIRWSGPAALAAGVSYALVGVFHPPNILASVTTPTWLVVHVLAMAMSIFGLVGLTGIYARQAEKSGWLGLAGYLLLTLWLALILGFTFVEVFILPTLATIAPAFVEAWLGVFNGTTSGINLTSLSTAWTISGLLYILGGILFGIATFRASLLPRWAGVLLAVATAMGPLAVLLPLDLQPKIAVPAGLALAWLGYSLWMERRAKSAVLKGPPAANFQATLAR
jgi:hypothetical protein